MVYLALDMANQTGWAVSDGKEVISGTELLSKPAAGVPASIRGLALLFTTLSQSWDIVDIVYEFPHHRGRYATASGYYLVGKLLELCDENNIKVQGVHSKAVKKWATGNGNASKDQMKEECIIRGYNPKDDNEADALLILEYHLHKLGVKHG